MSRGAYDSLNLAFQVEDSPAFVRQNREIVAEALKIDPQKFTCAKQVHGRRMEIVKKAQVGAGALDYDSAIGETDALATSGAGVPLAIFTADCVPLVLAEPKKRVIAAVHAGWRGTLSGIAAVAVQAVGAEFGVNPADLIAYLGPSIRSCSYNVDAGLHGHFKTAFPQIVGDELVLDLQTINIHQLMVAGLAPDNIFDLGLCTDHHPELFYSYRRDRTTGRQAVIAMVGKS